MGARLSSFPNYVIYDRSFQCSISSVATGATSGLTTNSSAYSRDSDLNTYYEVYAETSTLGDGGHSTTWDYGRILFNNIISYDIDFISAGANMQYILEFSIDGVAWTTIFSDAVNGGTENQSDSITLLALRYLRCRCYSGAHVGTQMTARFYEVRTLGSG